MESAAKYGSGQCFDEELYTKSENEIGSRSGHQLCAVYDQSYYVKEYGSSMTDKRKRVMWLKDRKFTKEEIIRGREYQEGFYMFGGINSQSECLNDLWLIRPSYQTNKRFISEHNYQYLGKDPEVTLNISKISDFKGQPPCPRSDFSMTHVSIKKTGV